MPNTLTEKCELTSTTKRKGVNCRSASKLELLSTLKASKPKKISTREPNCAVFEVTAK